MFEALKTKLKSTEFWLTFIALITGALVAAGVFADGTIPSRVAGMVIEVLAVMGYTIGRTLAKAGTNAAGKAGWRTSEFWKGLITALLVFVQTYLLPDGWAKEVIGPILALLPVSTYAIARGVQKAPPAPVLAADSLIEPTFGATASSNGG